MLVKCMNCGLIWRRVTPDDNPGGTVPLSAIQTHCPKCGSNAWEYTSLAEER